MDMKKLLILGANPETVKLVNKAKVLGYEVGVTDNNPEAYAKRVADYYYDIDGRDVETIVRKVQEDHIDGVLVGTADPLIDPYNQVCKKLGFRRYTTDEAVKAFTNKREFKTLCKRFGIEGVPEYSYKQILEGKNISYPILVKPEEGRSGKGISVCYSFDELDAAIIKAKKNSMNNECVFEKYMECDDVFMYYTFSGGKYYLSAMADRFTYKNDRDLGRVVLGAIYPSKYMDLYMQTIHEKMCSMFSYLNIHYGVFLVQAFVENGKIMVYDPGFRFQGGAPHVLLEKANGIDQESMMIKFAMGEDVDINCLKEKNDPEFGGKTVGSQTVLLREGIIGKIVGIEDVSRIPEVVSTTQRLKEGEEVVMTGTEQQILVRFHIVCDNKQDYKMVVNRINEVVDAYDLDGKSMKIGQFLPEWVK